MKLSVAEAVRVDVGRGIVRLGSDVMHNLNLNRGDIVKITGKTTAVARVAEGRLEDEKLDIIRMDSTIRNNAGVSLVDDVEVEKAESVPASSVSIAPLEEMQFTSDPTSFFHSRILDQPLIKGQKVIFDLMGTQLKFVVTKTTPSKIVTISRQTKVNFTNSVAAEAGMKIPDVSYEDIGGMKDEVDMIREMVELPMRHPEVFERLGIGAPKGVLLTGPPGTGKTLLAKAVASETESEFYSIAGPEIMSKFYGDSEKKIREIFEQAEKSSPSIIFIDEIDSLAPKRGEGRDQQEKRIVAQLLTLMDGLKSRGQVVVIAATNRPDDIDEALRRPGRFDRELKILPPKESGRKEILQIHSRGMPLDKDVDFSYLASKTIGFTGADLESLCKEAAMKALKPYMPSLKKYTVKVPTNILDTIKVKLNHFKQALQMVEPSAMREVLINKPKVKWTDIGGLSKVKQQLQELVELPLKKPELFRKAGIKPPKGILLSGPPGTGKTLIAKAVANESDANFISIKGPELVSKWVGESESRIREIFRKARQVAPSIVFFDEFDSISKVRGHSLTDSTERMVNQLLTELDGVEELDKVTVIAATNRPDLIDPALLRPGRIENHVEIGLPDIESREQIFKIHTKEMPLAKGVKLEEFFKKTDGWSGADIESLCRNAGLLALRDAKKDTVIVKKSHFNNAYSDISNSKNKSTSKTSSKKPKL